MSWKFSGKIYNIFTWWGLMLKHLVRFNRSVISYQFKRRREEADTGGYSHDHLQRWTWSAATAPRDRPGRCWPPGPSPRSCQSSPTVFYMKHFNPLPHRFHHFWWNDQSQILQIPMFFPLHRRREPRKKHLVKNREYKILSIWFLLHWI